MANKHFGQNDLPLIHKIVNYYKLRGITFPSFDNAMKFVQTELAEVYELDLARIGGWVRNNPQNKPTFSKESLAEELGDAIFMLIVAGIAEGVDPVAALEAKMERKLKTEKEKLKSATGISRLEEVEEPEEDSYNYAQDDMNFDAARERRMR